MEKKDHFFNIKVIQKLQNNYSPITNIEILNKIDTNTSNTFNTFWKGIEKNKNFTNTLMSDDLAKDEQELIIYDDDDEKNDEKIKDNATLFMNDKDESSPKMLEVLKVLEMLEH